MTLAGSAGVTLAVNGANFINGSAVKLNGNYRATSFVSATQLNAAIPASDIGAAGTVDITVTNPEPGGGTSNTLKVTILAQPYPVPNISSLSPNSATAGSAAFTLTVNGNDFVDASKVRWKVNDRQADLTTIFISATQLMAQAPATLIATAGTAEVTVFNPTPGGGTSNPVEFKISNGRPPVAYESDLSLRPSGDGAITSADWEMAGRFFIGLDTPAEESEFQRADSAPRSELGNGNITLADWVQAGRYAAGLDEKTAAVGPTKAAALNIFEALTQSSGALRIPNTTFQRGQVNTLQVEMDAQANENAVAFTINYDPQLMSFVDAAPSQELNEAQIYVNSARAAIGQIGIAFALPAGKAMLAGTSKILTLRFIATGGVNDVMTKVSFGDQVVRSEVVDVLANPMTGMTFSEGAVLVTGSAVAHVSAADYTGPMMAVESIVAAFGSELATQEQRATSLPLPMTLAGTTVKVKDSQGAERLAPLLYVSPDQVNYQIPEGIAEVCLTV